MKNIKSKTLKKLKRIQKSLQNWKGKTAARVQEILMEAEVFLMTPDNQLKLNLRFK